MKIELNDAHLEQLIQDLVNTTASEDFLDEVNRIADSEVEGKYEVASEVANANHLKQKGLNLPDNFRISLRNFEIPLDTSRAAKNTDDPMVCFEAGCASVLYGDTLVTVTIDNEEQEDRLSAAQIQGALIKEFVGLKAFVLQPGFQHLLDELYAQPENLRKKFVLDVILNADEIRKRGIEIPNEVYLRRSYFTDNRPTLFCVTKRTPLAYPWDKVTITFDNIVDE